MSNSEKYIEVGFNPSTILEIKKRLSSGYYNKEYSNGSTTITVEDQVLLALMKQIDTIVNIHEIEKLETLRDKARTEHEKDCLDYEIGLLKMRLNPEKYYPVI